MNGNILIQRMTATEHDKSYNDCHLIYKLKLGLLEYNKILKYPLTNLGVKKIIKLINMNYF